MVRENRYIVLKRSDVERYLVGFEKEELSGICSHLEELRKLNGKQSMRCVVVESDWPEYEPVCASIERREKSCAADCASGLDDDL